MAKQSAHEAVQDYVKIRPTYESCAKKFETLLREILAENHIKFQIVESRAKDVKSFAEKIGRDGKSYDDPLNEIDDLCGCRIVLYYQDDVAKAAELVKNEFHIKEENLSRQPEVLEVDRFGYLSAHYIVLLGKTRVDLIEWRAFIGIKVEIQIRTVIQHAWSAVSHALQYKQTSTVPSRMQRRLHRIAGLFELADEEFVSIRKMREDLHSETQRNIKEGRTNIALTLTSIQEFFYSWRGKDNFIRAISALNFNVRTVAVLEFADLIYDLAVLSGMSNLDELDLALQEPYISFFKRLIELSNSGQWMLDYDFAIALLLIKHASDRVTVDFLTKKGHFHPDVAGKVLQAASEISNT